MAYSIDFFVLFGVIFPLLLRFLPHKELLVSDIENLNVLLAKSVLFRKDALLCSSNSQKKGQNVKIPQQPTNSDICQKTVDFFQIALTPKQAGLVWIFFYTIIV